MNIDKVKNMNYKKFKILSIDGGGVRGVFPAMFLTKLEAELKARGKDNWQIYQNFDLICGTSTGGILAIGLALGIPAQNLYELYLENAKVIFGNKKGLSSIWSSKHSREALENLLKEKFEEANGGNEPRLKDCKTNICIPIYDLLNGTPSVLKKDHHPKFTRDYHIPAYKAALATSSAPTFFDPYSTEYIDLYGNSISFSNKVDGGVVANNPTLLGIIEAKEAFYKQLKDLQVLSIGTGHQKFTDGESRKYWGIYYWMNHKRQRITDLFMQGQSQLTENLISLLQNGIDKENEQSPRFQYIRVTTELSGSHKVALDETDSDKLKKLAEKASFEFSNNATKIIKTFCQHE